TINNEDGGSIVNEYGSAVVLHGGGDLVNDGSGSLISVPNGSISDEYSVKFWNEPGTVTNTDGAKISGPSGGVVLFAGGKVINKGVGSAIFATKPRDIGNGITVQGGRGSVTN